MSDTDTPPLRALDFACVNAKICPISHTPCPGECIFADVMASVGLGIVVVNQDTRELLFANPWARELFARVGVSLDYARVEELLLRPGTDTVSGSDTNGHAQQVQLGNRFLGFTVYSARGFAWVFVRDITEKARLEAIAAAVETTNNIGYVFSAVRHEIGNPINSIKVALGVLEANLDAFSRVELADYISRMSIEVGRIERLLRSLRSFSLYERPELAVLALEPFCHELGELVRPELDARGIRLEYRLVPGVTAYCDPRALHQVLMNLLTNATDALAGREQPRITIRCSCSDALATIRVEDNGVGVPEDHLAELFKPFSTTKPHGTGLGLVIARKLLAAMGATIAIESTHAVGTVVSIAIPSNAPKVQEAS